MQLKSWTKLVSKNANSKNPYGVRASMQLPINSKPKRAKMSEAERRAEKLRQQSKERNYLNKLPVGKHKIDAVILSLTKRKKFKTVTELRRAVEGALGSRRISAKQIEIDCRTTKICPSLDNRGRRTVKSKPPAVFNATEWREKRIRENPEITSHPLYRQWLSFGNNGLIEHAQNIARANGVNGQVAEARRFVLMINPPRQEAEVAKRFDAAIQKAVGKKR
ncbi:Uncharacterised protein [uncultured archaeon]|nr:Uncharacterised protein [uncultured archaeon]